MKYKNQYLLDNFDPATIAANRKNDNLKLSVQSGISTNNNPATEKKVMLRLRELEIINTQLEKRLAEQTEKLDEVVVTNARFLSVIGHDLRSPFSSIIGVLELLKDSNTNYNIAEVKKYIRMATKSANETIALLDNLLSWAVAQNKAIYFTPVKLNLLELVNDEFENLNTSAVHKQITLNHYISSSLFLTADLQMVKTILRNLIGNAIKYSFVGSDITVSASEGAHFVIIIVQDYGIGISHKAQIDLFKSNVIHSTRGTNNENGTGLGLILCKGFVEKHGGSIRVESESGKGSKFIFTLPQYA
jgi:signal transduction histidine kinase